MKNFLIVVLFLTFSISLSFGQKRLTRGINTSQEVEMNPVLSGDGQTMIFMRKYEMGPTWHLMITKKYKGEWGQPKTIDFYNKYVKMYNTHGYFLSYDGNTLYFTSKKQPGVGRYDVVFSELKNDQWTEPENFGKPLNSLEDEGCPSVSADGNTMYFVRGTIDPNGTIVGNIFTCQRKGKTTWTTPVEIVGSNINTGNETKPLILSDNQTMVFSSKRPGGKGGFDLYVSRLENGSWGRPQPMDNFNSSEDDLHLSVPASGDIGYYCKMHEDQSIDLFKDRIPEELQQKYVTMIYGTVLNKQGDTPVEGYVYVFDAEKNKQIDRYTIADDGSYWLFLTEGMVYDVAHYSKDGSLTFESKLYDGIDQSEHLKFREKVILSPLKKGVEFDLKNVSFAFNSTNMQDYSEGELKRFVKLLKSKPEMKVQLKVTLLDYREDSVSSRELSEIRIDTLSSEPDSLGEWETKTTYHNNRTTKQSEVIKSFLVSNGVSEDQIEMKPEATADPKYAKLNKVVVNVKVL